MAWKFALEGAASYREKNKLSSHFSRCNEVWDICTVGTGTMCEQNLSRGGITYNCSREPIIKIQHNWCGYLVVDLKKSPSQNHEKVSPPLVRY
jgi:hypothetical protein